MHYPKENPYIFLTFLLQFGSILFEKKIQLLYYIYQGLIGLEGPHGEPGVPGCNGTNGCDGKMGIPGFSGRRGPPGAFGEQGIQGVNAFHEFFFLNDKFHEFFTKKYNFLLKVMLEMEALILQVLKEVEVWMEGREIRYSY